MKTVVVAIIVILILAIFGVALAQNEELWSCGNISLLRIGTRVYSVEGKIVQEPIFAIRISDTSQAELEAFFWGKYFAEYSFNATFYVKKDKDGENWKAMTYRRPTSLEEVEKFFENPPESFKKFYSEKDIKKEELPFSLGKLELKNFYKIDFILIYLNEGAKVYLVCGITFEEARRLAQDIISFLKK